MNESQSKDVYSFVRECIMGSIQSTSTEDTINKLNGMEDQEREKWLDKVYSLFLPGIIALLLLPTAIGLLTKTLNLENIVITLVFIIIILLLLKHMGKQIRVAAKIKTNLNAIRSVKEEVLKNQVRKALEDRIGFEDNEL